MIDLIHIGSTGKKRGIQGHFKIRLNDDQFIPDLSKARAVFIHLNGSKVPFLISEVQKSSDVLIKLDEINTPEEVNYLLNKDLYLDKKEVRVELLDTEIGDNHVLVGFTIIDQGDSKIGTILEIKEYPEQMIAEVETQNGLKLIPIHQNLILDLNEDNQMIKMQLIDGLLDL